MSFTDEPFDDPVGWDNRAHFMPRKLEQPFHWRKPRRIFVCSMSDLFHESLTNEQIAAIYGVMAASKQHTYIVLTKRPERAFEWHQWLASWGDGRQYAILQSHLAGHITIPRNMRSSCEDIRPTWINRFYPWPLPNVIFGVSVENQKTADERILLLLQTPAAHRFVSYEPALEKVNFRHMDIDQGEFYQIDALTGRNTDMGRPCPYVAHVDLLIAGAETGPGARPCNPDWLRSVRDQCSAAGVPFFLKQINSTGDRELDGKRHDVPYQTRLEAVGPGLALPCGKMFAGGRSGLEP